MEAGRPGRSPCERSPALPRDPCAPHRSCTLPGPEATSIGRKPRGEPSSWGEEAGGRCSGQYKPRIQDKEPAHREEAKLQTQWLRHTKPKPSTGGSTTTLPQITGGPTGEEQVETGALSRGNKGGPQRSTRGQRGAEPGQRGVPPAGEHTQDSPSLLSISNSALKQGDLPGERTERDEGG